MEDLLPRRGHTVHVAGDGRAALMALEKDDFDVMVLDIHMPELDGFQVVAVQRQREQGAGRRLPVIALTARSAAGERERSLQAGRGGYLVKAVRAGERFGGVGPAGSGERGVGWEVVRGRRWRRRGPASPLPTRHSPTPVCSILPRCWEPATPMPNCYGRSAGISRRTLPTVWPR